MAEIIQSTSIKDAKKQMNSAIKKHENRKTAERGDDRESVGVRRDGKSFITIAQHEALMSAVLVAFAEQQDNKVMEYIEYRLSVRGRLVAYRRLWEFRIGRVIRPIYIVAVWCAGWVKGLTNEGEVQVNIVPDGDGRRLEVTR